MSVLVREEWYVFYKECEENLAKIRKILEDKDFMDFYDESDKEQSDHWQDFIIPIFNLCTQGNPEHQKHIQARVQIEKEQKNSIHIG